MLVERSQTQSLRVLQCLARHLKGRSRQCGFGLEHRGFRSVMPADVFGGSARAQLFDLLAVEQLFQRPLDG